MSGIRDVNCMVVNSWWSTACPNSWFYLLPSIILTKRFIFTKQARKPQSCWKLCVDTDALTDYRRQSPSLSFLLHLNSQFPSYLVVFLRLMLNRNETRWTVFRSFSSNVLNEMCPMHQYWPPRGKRIWIYHLLADLI